MEVIDLNMSGIIKVVRTKAIGSALRKVGGEVWRH